MALQGMDIEIHDIDIQTSQKGAYEIEALYLKYVVKPVQYLMSERIHSHFGILKIDGVKVEIMGGIQKLSNGQAWEEPVKVEQYRHWIKYKGMQVPVLSLEYEYQAYLQLGRIDKAEIIRKWLEQRRVSKATAG